MFAFDPNSDASESGLRILRNLLSFVFFFAGLGSSSRLARTSYAKSPLPSS